VAVVHNHRPFSIQEDPVSTSDTPIDQQALSIGRHIREIRRARGLTLVQLAAAAQLSHPFLSQLERGLARPSMGSLDRIAHALGSSQVELLAPADAFDALDQPPVSFVRAHEGAQGPYGFGDGRILVQGTRGFQPMELVGTSSERGDYFVHAEDEFVHVLAGALEVDLDEGATRLLAEGDSLYFVGGTRHRWWAPDEQGYRLIVVKEKRKPL
jgi:quercetin dioxygenase-like cupin family protein/DNA-binding XRE family transcriptional regulator